MKTLEMDLRARDLTAVETALPAHLMFLMAEECARKGLILREDVHHKLNVASAAPLSRLDTFSVVRVAKEIDKVARDLLHDLSPDDPRDGLYCCVQFCLKLVDEGRLNDPQNVAVLVALLLMDDVKDDKTDEAGNAPLWRLDEARWKEKAGRMMSRCVLQGYYALPTCN
jgi:hypothetical protein